MSDKSSTQRVRLGEWDFDLATGELFSTGEQQARRRLPPQPAKLLALLVAKNGELLSREEIRREIWPGVEVEFDQGLAFCVRQVRQALEDSAETPRYVETLPRRGYRLLEKVDPGESPPRERRLRLTPVRLLVVAGSLALVLSVLWLANTRRDGSTRRSSPVRLAIMPFEPPAGAEMGGDPSQIAHRLLAALGAAGREELEVIGPTTTGAYATDPRSVQRLISERDVDLLVNGRFFTGDADTELLVELIRATDGAHIWVQRCPAGSDWGSVATDIERAVSDAVASLKVQPAH